MTPEEARAAVEEIRASIEDDEGAHSMEDSLYHRFVKVIAGLPDSEPVTWFDVADWVGAAKILLETEEMDFARWCA